MAALDSRVIVDRGPVIQTCSSRRHSSGETDRELYMVVFAVISSHDTKPINHIVTYLAMVA